MSGPLLNAEILGRLNESVYSAFAMLAGMQLDVFTPLKDGPLSAAQIATAIGGDEARLRPLLYALVTVGLLEVEEELFSNAPEAAHFLVRGRADFMGERHHLWSDIWSATLKTAESIRTGVPQAKHDFSSMSEEQLEEFLRGLHPRAMAGGRAFAHDCDLSFCRTLLDVGGGSGGFAIGVTEVVPHVRAVVTDLPRVVPIARHFVEEAGAEDRVEVVAADWVEQTLTDRFDVAILKNFIQVLSPERACSALKHVSAAVKPGGRIYIMGDILDNSRLGPEETVTFNLVFINIYEQGQAYTQGEYEDWLKQAGFEEIEFVTSDMITARKVGRS